MKSTEVTIVGVTALLMHSGRLADPLDPSSKALAAAVKRKKASKSDEGEMTVRKAEWFGGLYLGEDGAPCLPSEVIEGSLISGAKKLRLGAKGKTLIVQDSAPLIYKGPKDPEEMWESGLFRKVCGVRVQNSRVIRTRPMFPTWRATFTVLWDPSILADENELIEIIDAAGQGGIGDYRPKYGRFEVES